MGVDEITESEREDETPQEPANKSRRKKEMSNSSPASSKRKLKHHLMLCKTPLRSVYKQVVVRTFGALDSERLQQIRY